MKPKINNKIPTLRTLGYFRATVFTGLLSVATRKALVFTVPNENAMHKLPMKLKIKPI